MSAAASTKAAAIWRQNAPLKKSKFERQIT
jgi:hypothetical protein